MAGVGATSSRPERPILGRIADIVLAGGDCAKANKDRFNRVIVATGIRRLDNHDPGSSLGCAPRLRRRGLRTSLETETPPIGRVAGASVQAACG